MGCIIRIKTKRISTQGKHMLKIINTVSFDILANDMLAQINACWQNPFSPPIIVFTDAKTEQWFKLHALERNGIFMNLCTARLESFLFNLLKTDENQYLLSPSLLRDIIIQKLLQRQGDKLYIEKIKDLDNIGNYLNITEDVTNIDYKHLFEFANDLANLFIEYEATRENIDHAIPENHWQKDLYNDIINDGIELNARKYYTCPELAIKNKIHYGGKTVFKKLTQPVFIFGFSGMGQTYRNLLKEFGKSSDIYVYLQTPNGKGSEENDNIFLKHWARFGKTNYDLFDPDSTGEYKHATYTADTTLGRLQNTIAQDININDHDDLKTTVNQQGEKAYDNTLTITSMPSKIKELEIVHSEICKLLKDKNASLKDILVLAPDIKQYKSAITTVFNQIDQNDTDSEFPFIPTSIVDYCEQNSAVFDALKTLYSILHNGGLTRKSFYALAKNPEFQRRFNITDDDVTNVFQPWIENMRVFRTHNLGDAKTSENIIDDWEMATNRLLIAKLTNQQICLNNKTIEPFSDFNTEDNELLERFVQIFDVLKNKWIERFKTKYKLNQSDIADLQDFLTDFFAMNEDNKNHRFKEVFVYKKINRKLNQYLEQYQKYDNPFPMECILLSLIDVASNIVFDAGTLFTQGVTFTSLIPNRILPAKYVFLLGMNSDNFPGVKKTSVLDQRASYPQYGDDDICNKNKNAFLCQLMATRKELHISFVDRDLQTDNVFYPAYVLDVLTKYTGIKTQKIGIDENRKWADLYTPRARRNKQIFIDLNNPDSTESQNQPQTKNTDDSNKDLPDSVRIKTFERFIENPLYCYVKRVLGDEEDTSNQELEDIELNHLNKYILQKCLAKPLLQYKKHKNQPDQTPYDTAPKKTQWTDYKDLLPNKPFAELEFNRTQDELEYYIDAFMGYHLNDGTSPDIIPNLLINLSLLYTDDRYTKKYILHGEIPMCAYTDTDILLYVQDKENKVRKHYPEMYALVAQIAQQNQDYTKEYNVHIVYISNTDGTITEISHEISGEIATEKLNELYKRVFIDEDKQYLPYLDDEIDKISSLEDLNNYFLNPHKNYMPYKESFTINDLGFSEDDFLIEFCEARLRHADLLKIDSDKE